MAHRTATRNVARHGSSLVEMLIVITALTFLLGIVGVVTHTLLRAHRATRAEIDARRSLVRLSTRFRADGHAATGYQQANARGEGVAELTFVRDADRHVRYRFLGEPNGVERTELAAGAVVHRDTFRLPRGASVDFPSASVPTPAVAAAVIRWPVGERPGTAERTLRIETAVGLHHRAAGGSAPDGGARE